MSPKSVVIINGNPAQKRRALCVALAEAYGEGATAAGGRAAVFHLKDLRFDPILHEGYAEDQALEPDLLALRQAMVAADHLVFVFPIWHGMTPALFKAFLDRVITRGFAFNYKHGWPVPTDALRGKTAEILLTCSMPAFMYRYLSGAYASRALKATLKLCGVKTQRVSVFGMASREDPAARRFLTAYVEKARRLGRALI